METSSIFQGAHVSPTHLAYIGDLPKPSTYLRPLPKGSNYLPRGFIYLPRDLLKGPI